MKEKVKEKKKQEMRKIIKRRMTSNKTEKTR